MSRKRAPIPAPAEPPRVLARATVAGVPGDVFATRRDEDGGRLLRLDGGAGGGWFRSERVAIVEPETAR